jgi:hypothetical protein
MRLIPNPAWTAMRKRVQSAARQRILFLPHAIRQMARPDRMIATEEVRRVIMKGEMIEDYPEDARGHSFLLLGDGTARKLHVVCSPKPDYLAVIIA